MYILYCTGEVYFHDLYYCPQPTQAGWLGEVRHEHCPSGPIEDDAFLTCTLCVFGARPPTAHRQLVLSCYASSSSAVYLSHPQIHESRHHQTLPFRRKSTSIDHRVAVLHPSRPRLDSSLQLRTMATESQVLSGHLSFPAS
jgi:hypothetical protein